MKAAIEREMLGSPSASWARTLRRYVMLGGLLAAILVSIVEPAGASHSGQSWPTSQLFRRGLINCYHYQQRSVDSKTESVPDAGAVVR